MGELRIPKSCYVVFVFWMALPSVILLTGTSCDLVFGKGWVSPTLRDDPESFSGPILAFGQVATGILFGVVMAATGALEPLKRIRAKLVREVTILELGRLDKMQRGRSRNDDSDECDAAHKPLTKGNEANRTRAETDEIAERVWNLEHELTSTKKVGEGVLETIRKAMSSAASEFARDAGRAAFLERKLKLSRGGETETREKFLSWVRAQRVPMLSGLHDDLAKTEAAVFSGMGRAVGLGVGLTVCCFSPDVLAATVATQLVDRISSCMRINVAVDGKLDYVYGSVIVFVFTVLMMWSVYRLARPVVKSYWMRFDEWL